MSYEGYEYPTDDDLKRIEEWRDFWKTDPKHADYSELFAFVKSLWWMPDWGWREYEGTDDLFDAPIRVLHLSTGGWSGNESLIGALSRNFIAWSQTFHTHRRGGHYTLWLPKPDPPAPGRLAPKA